MWKFESENIFVILCWNVYMHVIRMPCSCAKYRADIIDVVLVSLLLFFNKFHTLLWCLHCWLWTSNDWLGYYRIINLSVPLFTTQLLKRKSNTLNKIGTSERKTLTLCSISDKKLWFLDIKFIAVFTQQDTLKSPGHL